MPLVFVHGNVESTAIWTPLIERLGRADVVTLSPPGFGAPVPPGFAATSDDYVSWLIGELEAIEGPRDLIGHDWGGLHVQRVVTARPDLVRSWCSDGVGATDARYEWHDLAQLWQTPGIGETLVETFLSSTPADVVAGLVSRGMTPEAARSSAAVLDETWGSCILPLSRSAAHPALAVWGAALRQAPRRPALAILAPLDPLSGGPMLVRRAAMNLGAQLAVLEGLGHMWMLEDPETSAAALAQFFSGL